MGGGWGATIGMGRGSRVGERGGPGCRLLRHAAERPCGPARNRTRIRARYAELCGATKPEKKETVAAHAREWGRPGWPWLPPSAGGVYGLGERRVAEWGPPGLGSPQEKRNTSNKKQKKQKQKKKKIVTSFLGRSRSSQKKKSGLPWTAEALRCSSLWRPDALDREAARDPPRRGLTARGASACRPPVPLPFRLWRRGIRAPCFASQIALPAVGGRFSRLLGR